MDRKDFFTVREASEFLQTSENRIYQLLWAGKLTRYKMNRKTLLLKSEVKDRLKIVKVDY